MSIGSTEAYFYAMSALLLTKGLSPSKHAQVRALLPQGFQFRSGIIPLQYGQIFDLLFNNRQKGDYSDLVVFQAEQVRDWLPQARRVRRVRLRVDRSVGSM